MIFGIIKSIVKIVVIAVIVLVVWHVKIQNKTIGDHILSRSKWLSSKVNQTPIKDAAEKIGEGIETSGKFIKENSEVIAEKAKKTIKKLSKDDSHSNNKEHEDELKKIMK